MCYLVVYKFENRRFIVQPCTFTLWCAHYSKIYSVVIITFL